jgi:endonuclease YncB( thermonuclease family)
MKPHGACISVIATILLLLPLPGHAATPRTLVATVAHVTDGDTLVTVSENESMLSILLLGIYAPEIRHGSKPGQSYGEEAGHYLNHLIGRKTLRVDA